jgi:hypothetical protein
LTISTAYAPPSFVDVVICGVNEGWADAPTVFIDEDGAPTVARDEDPSTTISAVKLVQDAISDYWNENSDIDGEDENSANSAFKGPPGPGFGAVTVGSEPGGQDIIITFDLLPAGILGVAQCTVDSSTGNIVSASITLTTSVSGLTDEDYKNVAAHELGHVVGLQHSGPPGTLMFRALTLGSPAYLPLSKQSLKTLEILYG